VLKSQFSVDDMKDKNIHIEVVLGSNLSPEIGCSDPSVFVQSLQANAGYVLQVKHNCFTFIH
jgi:hypothetical protein